MPEVTHIEILETLVKVELIILLTWIHWKAYMLFVRYLMKWQHHRELNKQLRYLEETKHIRAYDCKHGFNPIEK